MLTVANPTHVDTTNGHRSFVPRSVAFVLTFPLGAHVTGITQHGSPFNPDGFSVNSLRPYPPVGTAAVVPNQEPPAVDGFDQVEKVASMHPDENHIPCNELLGLRRRQGNQISIVHLSSH